MSKKQNKRLGKKCPLCEGILEAVTYTQNKSGVTYEKKFIECLECDYREEVKSNHNKRSMNENEYEEVW